MGASLTKPEFKRIPEHVNVWSSPQPDGGRVVWFVSYWKDGGECIVWDGPTEMEAIEVAKEYKLPVTFGRVPDVWPWANA